MKNISRTPDTDTNNHIGEKYRQDFLARMERKLQAKQETRYHDQAASFPKHR
jgi:hypothetical protein